MQDLGTVISLIFAVIVTIIVIVATYYGSKWAVKRMSSLSSSKYINILDKAPLAQDKFLAITKIGEKHFLISVTPHNINLLTELEGTDLIENTKKNGVDDFSKIFKNIMQGKNLKKSQLDMERGDSWNDF